MVSEENASKEVHSQEEKSTPSPGALLKERREALGLSQQDVATKLFLKSSQINDLENDAIDEKSSITFTKGYVRNYARQLGLPSDEVIEAFEKFHNQSEVPSSEKLQSFSKRVAKQTHDDRWMMVTYIILLLIIGGVVVWWYQQPSDDSPTDASLVQSVKDEVIASARSPESNDEIAVTNGTGELDSASGTAGQSTFSQSENALQSEEIADQNSQNSAFVANTPDDGPIDAPPSNVDDSNNLTALVSDITEDDNVELNLGEAEQDLAYGDGPSAAPISMTFTFGEDCWVNNEDATGELIATGVKRQGRVMDIQGIPPVAVTLGAPDNVRISVNGELANIASFQNGKIARFTLPL